MDVRALHREFKVLMDKVDTEALPDFIPTEIDIMLNLGQHRYIDDMHKLRSMRLSTTERRKIDLVLSKLIVRKHSIPLTSGVGTLPNNYMAHEVASVVTGTREVPGVILSHFEGELDLQDPFNKADVGYPIISFSGNSIHVDGGGEVCKLTYMRQPTDISYSNNVTCELPEYVHRDIVKEAVKIALETIESPRGRAQQ
jgi:hypothetical protein